MKWIRRIRKLRRNERGNALIVFATTLPLVIGSAAVAVDTVQVSVAKRQLQRAADSAALAGAYALVQSQDQTPTVRSERVSTAANHDLTMNNDGLGATVSIQNAPAAGSFAGDPKAVRVVLSAQRAAPFMSFFTGSNEQVSVEATAAMIYEGQYCAVSLEEGDTTGISMGGNATVNLGCGMITNSRSAIASFAFGNSTVVASPIAAVGGIPESSSYTSGTVYLPYSPPQADPYKHLPAPSVPSSCSPVLNVQPNTSYTVPANPSGIYCFRGMDVKGNLTLPSGTYYIDGSHLGFGAQSVVTGSNVTFILTSSNATSNPSSIADLSINGGATLNLTAPATGTYQGVLFYQDRRAPLGTSIMNGNASSFLRGSLYFPSRILEFNGTAGMQTECVQIVSRRIQFNGTSSINNVCPANSGAQAFNSLRIRLVA